MRMDSSALSGRHPGHRTNSPWIVAFFGLLVCGCSTPTTAARLLFQRGNTPRPAEPSWHGTPNTALIDGRSDHPLMPEVVSWGERRLRPRMEGPGRSARLHAPVIACRPGDPPVCAARIVVEWLGVDGQTPLAAAEGRAQLTIAGSPDGGALARAMPSLLDAALRSALRAPDRRPAPRSAIAQAIRRGDSSELAQWIQRLESPQTPAAERTALWVAVGHVGGLESLERLVTIVAKDEDEARAKARAIGWIRAAGVNAGKRPADHVKSPPGVQP